MTNPLPDKYKGFIQKKPYFQNDPLKTNIRIRIKNKTIRWGTRKNTTFQKVGPKKKTASDIT